MDRHLHRNRTEDPVNINESDYVVLDVETNGLSSLKHDLLSISIYQPDTGKLYNRFLPLELNSDVYTSHVNGITKKDIESTNPLSQKEVDDLITEYDLCNRTILTYGNLDEKFIKNYFKRKGLCGYHKLHFFNFKRNIISYSAQFVKSCITKDNLCRLYGIDGIKKIHTGANDCLLEWELFKKMDNHKLLITDSRAFELSEDYIVPASYLVNYPNFKYYLQNLPKFHYTSKEVKRFDVTNIKIATIPANMIGIVFEHLINVMLNVEKIDSRSFLIENKKKLKYIGKMPCLDDQINIQLNYDGTVSPTERKDESKVSKFNDLLLLLMNEFAPVRDYIKQDIFKNQHIVSQELVIHPNKNILALCDLSNPNAVLEIKSHNPHNMDPIINQLYYESNGRDSYVLTVDKPKQKDKMRIIITKYEFTTIDSSSFPNAKQSSSPQPSENADSDSIDKLHNILTLLKSLKISYVDNRKTSGLFWIIGDKNISDFINWCENSGFKFTFNSNGGIETNGKPGWWIKQTL